MRKKGEKLAVVRILESHSQDGKIIFITENGLPKYELWEMSSIWSVSKLEGEKELIKKHEEFYFAFKFLLIQLMNESMDKHFDKKEETFEF